MLARTAVRMFLTMRPVEPPGSVVVIRRACQARAQIGSFDDSYTGGGSDGGMGPKPPSDKQLAYAKRLAMQNGAVLPDDVHSSSMSCSRFIDEQLSMTMPSAKQLEYAELLASRAGTSLPPESMKSAASISKYIEENGGGRSGGSVGSASSGMQGMQNSNYQNSNLPTEKQLLFAIRLARERSIGLPAEVIAEKSSCSRFIDDLVNGGAPQPQAGGGYAAGLGMAGGAAAVAPDADPIFGDGTSAATNGASYAASPFESASYKAPLPDAAPSKDDIFGDKPGGSADDDDDPIPF